MTKKQYQVYVRPKARSSLATRGAINQINKALGGKTVKYVTNRRAADAVVGFGQGGTKYAGVTHRGETDVIKINKAAKTMSKSAYRRTISHEIGHGLGLGHTATPNNLMNPSTGGYDLKPKQIKKVRKTKRTGGYR